MKQSMYLLQSVLQLYLDSVLRNAGRPQDYKNIQFLLESRVNLTCVEPSNINILYILLTKEKVKIRIDCSLCEIDLVHILVKKIFSILEKCRKI